VNVESDRNVALKSHHFIVVANFRIQLARIKKQELKPHLDIKSLGDDRVRQSFVHTLEQKIDVHMSMHQNEDIDNKVNVFTELLRNTAEETLPEIKARAQRPWISARTLHYIDERTAARHTGDKHT